MDSSTKRKGEFLPPASNKTPRTSGGDASKNRLPTAGINASERAINSNHNVWTDAAAAQPFSATSTNATLTAERSNVSSAVGSPVSISTGSLDPSEDGMQPSAVTATASPVRSVDPRVQRIQAAAAAKAQSSPAPPSPLSLATVMQSGPQIPSALENNLFTKTIAIENLTDKLTRKKDDWEKNQARLAKHPELAKRLQSDVKAIEKELRQQRQAHQVLQQRIATEKATANASATWQNGPPRLAPAQREELETVKALQETVQVVQSRLGTQSAQNEKYLNAVTERVNSVESDAARAQVKVDDLGQKLLQAIEDVKAIRKAHEVAVEKSRLAEERHQGNVLAVSEIFKQKQEVEQQTGASIQVLSTKHVQLESTVGALRTNLSRVEQAIKVLDTDVARANSDTNRLGARIATEADNMKALAHSVAELVNAVSAIERQIDVSRGGQKSMLLVIASLEDGLKSLVTKYQHLYDELFGEGGAVPTLGTNQQALVDKIKQLVNKDKVGTPASQANGHATNGILVSPSRAASGEGRSPHTSNSLVDAAMEERMKKIIEERISAAVEERVSAIMTERLGAALDGTATAPRPAQQAELWSQQEELSTLKAQMRRLERFAIDLERIKRDLGMETHEDGSATVFHNEVQWAHIPENKLEEIEAKVDVLFSAVQRLQYQHDNLTTEYMCRQIVDLVANMYPDIFPATKAKVAQLQEMQVGTNMEVDKLSHRVAATEANQKKTDDRVTELEESLSPSMRRRSG